MNAFTTIRIAEEEPQRAKEKISGSLLLRNQDGCESHKDPWIFTWSMLPFFAT